MAEKRESARLVREEKRKSRLSQAQKQKSTQIEEIRDRIQERDRYTSNVEARKSRRRDTRENIISKIYEKKTNKAV